MNNSHGLDTLEVVSLVSAVGGTIASVLTQQVAFAAIPLSLTATLSLANRKRQLNIESQMYQVEIATLEEKGKQQQLAIDELVQQDQQTQNEIAILIDQSQDNKTKIAALTSPIVEIVQCTASLPQKVDELQQKSQDLANSREKIENTLQLLQEIDQLNQAIRANPKTADLYYRRGMLRQGLNRKDDQLFAQEDYTQAIQLDPAHAGAYWCRGMLASKQGNKRPAAEDFRAAAKAYFEQGDLENYDKAKALSQEMHELITALPDDGDVSDRILVESLFD